MGKYKVIIAGCRDFSNYALLAEKCDYYLHDKIQTHEVIIVSGHAKGADTPVSYTHLTLPTTPYV